MRCILTLVAILAVPLVASAQVRVVHEKVMTYADLPRSTHTEVKRVAFHLDAQSTVIVTATGNLEGLSCSGSPCSSDTRGSTFAFVYSGVKLSTSSSWYGGVTYAPAQILLSGGVSAAATAVQAWMPISVSHTAVSLPPGDYEAVTSGYSSGNDRARLRSYATTILIIPDA
jgi:hypothetical protein